MTDHVAELEAWAERERANGLVDIKFFPRLPTDPPMDLQEAAKSVLDLVTGGVDIGDEDL